MYRAARTLVFFLDTEYNHKGNPGFWSTASTVEFEQDNSWNNSCIHCSGLSEVAICRQISGFNREYRPTTAEVASRLFHSPQESKWVVDSRSYGRPQGNHSIPVPVVNQRTFSTANGCYPLVDLEINFTYSGQMHQLNQKHAGDFFGPWMKTESTSKR